MAVLSVKMATGFVPDKQSLQELQSDNKVQLMRYEVEDNQLNLYFNEVTNVEKCFTFFISREVVVLDLKAASVHLYDYYQPEYEITMEYTIPNACTATPLMPEAMDDEKPTDNPSSETSPLPVRMRQETTISDDGTTRVSKVNVTTDIPVSRLLEDEMQMETSISPPQYVTDDINDPDTILETLQDIDPAELESEAKTDDSTVSDNITEPSSEEISEVHQRSFASPTEETEKGKTDVAYSIEDVEQPAATEDSNLEPAVVSAADSRTRRLEDVVDKNQLDITDHHTHEKHLVNFVDREEDLDFPDSIEENFPVTILPPNGDIEHTLEGNGVQGDS